MKKSFLILLLAIFSAVMLLAGQSILESFIAESSGNNIVVKWRSNDEVNLLRYELERAANPNVFKTIETRNALGKPSYYTFTDEEAFMKRDAGSENNNSLQANNFYTYRLKIVYKDNNTSYSDAIVVAHKPSSIKRTWGMLKEMFR